MSDEKDMTWILPESLPEGTIPCPFCCDDGLRFMNSDKTKQFAVYCYICESAGPWADSREGALKKWNERKYNANEYSALQKIAERLGEMNEEEHSDLFEHALFYREPPGNWEIVDIVMKIIDAYDAKRRSIPESMVKLHSKITSALEEYDQDWERFQQ